MVCQCGDSEFPVAISGLEGEIKALMREYGQDAVKKSEPSKSDSKWFPSSGWFR